MVCYSPLKAFQACEVNVEGKRPVIFWSRSHGYDPIELPCGSCVGCRLERSRQWAVRCVHEAQLWERNCFITLTYDDDHLPIDRSLDVRHFQKFMKRLRKRFGKGIRFYHCGEYGEQFGRPHYHALLFNFDFSDREFWKVQNDQRYYKSQIANDVWGLGNCIIGDVSFESAAYVARYILKKVNGDFAEEHYQWFDSDTGIIFQRKPEYTTMSRRPGIGKGWLDLYESDVYREDFVVMNNKKFRAPRYYDAVFKAYAPHDFEVIKERRVENAKKHLDNNTPSRLAVRETIQMRRLELLKRNIE